MPFLADVSHSCNSVQKEVGAGNALPNGAEGEACVWVNNLHKTSYLLSYLNSVCLSIPLTFYRLTKKKKGVIGYLKFSIIEIWFPWEFNAHILDWGSRTQRFASGPKNFLTEDKTKAIYLGSSVHLTTGLCCCLCSVVELLYWTTNRHY